MDWAGACALVLAIGISVGLMLGMFRWVVQKQTLSAEGAQLLGTIYGAAVGTLATYLGLSRQQQKTQRDEEVDREEPPET